MILFLSDCIIPIMILGIVFYGMLEKIKVYDEFICGAKKGIQTVVQIMPTLIGLMTAVGILRASGFLEMLAELLGNLSSHIGFPSQLMPLAIVRMFSSSAATSLALDIFKEYGPDSDIGLMVSILMGCTETLFYTMSVYYMSIGVRKTRWTLPGALAATLAGATASIILAGIVG